MYVYTVFSSFYCIIISHFLRRSSVALSLFIRRSSVHVAFFVFIQNFNRVRVKYINISIELMELLANKAVQDFGSIVGHHKQKKTQSRTIACPNSAFYLKKFKISNLLTYQLSNFLLVTRNS